MNIFLSARILWDRISKYALILIYAKYTQMRHIIVNHMQEVIFENICDTEKVMTLKYIIVLKMRGNAEMDLWIIYVFPIIIICLVELVSTTHYDYSVCEQCWWHSAEFSSSSSFFSHSLTSPAPSTLFFSEWKFCCQNIISKLIKEDMKTSDETNKYSSIHIIFGNLININTYTHTYINNSAK